MARGIAAFVFVVSLVFSMSILGGVGYYAALGVDVEADSHNQDVQEAAEQLESIEFGEGRSGSILEGPLAVVMPVIGILKTFIAVLKNTSGLMQLLYGVPKAVADPIETLFRLAMLITLAFLIRGAVQ